MENEEYMWYRFLNLIVALLNCITLICFTVLAIAFQKWWIALIFIIFRWKIGNREEDK